MLVEIMKESPVVGYFLMGLIAAMFITFVGFLIWMIHDANSIGKK